MPLSFHIIARRRIFFLYGKEKLFPGLNEAMNVEALQLLCCAIYSCRQPADSADVENENSFIVLHETQFERSIFCISHCIKLYRYSYSITYTKAIHNDSFYSSRFADAN